MIDSVSVLTQGGVVLWSRSLVPVDPNKLNRIVEQVFVQDKSSAGSIKDEHHTVKWARINRQNLLVVAAYLHHSSMFSVDALLDDVAVAFSSQFEDDLSVAGTCTHPLRPSYPFDASYARIEESYVASMRPRSAKAPRSFAEASKAKTAAKASKQGSKPGPMRKKKKGKEASKEENKKGRDWSQLGGVKSHVSKEDVERLDRGAEETEEEDRVAIERVESEPESEFEEEEEAPKGGMFRFLSDLVTGKELQRSDLEAPLGRIKETLLTRNVATSIAELISDSVADSLVGQALPSFTTVYSAARSAMEQALLRVLTPQRPLDLLRDVRAAQQEKRPYTIVFVGVNGVGKSTSLSKVCYYLLARGLRVSMAACDTFRAGAVEQLKTHAKRMNVSVYAQGYDKDAASVAEAGIRSATANGDDVLLIDTAGRMQNNEPLMRSLSKLVVKNQPDLVLFVGEALGGNDTVDQLEQFNKALVSYAPKDQRDPHQVDGIVLTKFDTIDDKVGAAVSMTYATGKPIVFVGVGQTYKDLRHMSARGLIKKLLQ